MGAKGHREMWQIYIQACLHSPLLQTLQGMSRAVLAACFGAERASCSSEKVFDVFPRSLLARGPPRLRKGDDYQQAARLTLMVLDFHRKDIGMR